MADFYLLEGAYLMYLRKSRADNPHETVAEVLRKHETMLQEKATRDLGGRIPEDCIFREVLSGETIDDRPMMLSLLSRIEGSTVKGVLVVEPQRLSRGDLEDCGRIVNVFRYSKTAVITLTMDYDLENKMQRKFFEQELMRGNDYLEYTKEILLRGRIASVKKGNYIWNTPPFGYDRYITPEKDYTLIPNTDAPFVQLAFQLYVNEGRSYLQIANQFNRMGIHTASGKSWEKTTIRKMLSNRHYIGQVFFGRNRTEKTVISGQIVKHKGIRSDDDAIIIAKGKHQPIIDAELFEAAQARIDNAPRAPANTSLKNPFAGLVFCHQCGKAMVLHQYKAAQSRLECRNRSGCATKSVSLLDMINTIATTLELQELPDLEAHLQDTIIHPAAYRQAQLDKLHADLQMLHRKNAKQHDLLEEGIYSNAVFLQRNKQLSLQIEALQAKIAEVKQSSPPEVDYGSQIVKLKDAISALHHYDFSTAESTNKILKSIIQRIDYEYEGRISRGQTKFEVHVFLKGQCTT